MSGYEWRDFPNLNLADDLPEKPKQAFFHVKYQTESKEDEKKLLGWLNRAKEFAFAIDAPFQRQVRENIALYQGFAYHEDKAAPNRRELLRLKNYGHRSNYFEDRRLISNYIQDFVESKISTETSYRNQVKAVPSNSMEERDITNAQGATDIMRTLMYDNKIDSRMPAFSRIVHLSQEGYWQVGWNEDKGPEAASYKKAKEAVKRIPILEDNGDPVRDGAGNPKFIDKVIRIGEVDFIERPGYDITFEPVWFGQKPRWAMVRWREDVDVIRAQNPDVADDIKAEFDGFYDFATGQVIAKGNHVEVTDFYYAADEFIPKGWWCRFVKGAVCFSKELPYRHGKFPLVKLSDIDVPGLQRAISFIRNTKPIQESTNNLKYLFQRLLYLAATPKIMVEENSVELAQLGNEPGIISVKTGAQRPEMLSQNSIPPQLAPMIEFELQEMQRLNSVHPIAQGLPPPGAKSGEAFKVLSQQYNVRQNSYQTKFNQAYLELNEMGLQTATQYYPSGTDERLIKVFGEDDGEYMIEKLQSAVFESSYDVRLEVVSALGETESARIENSLMMLDRGLMTQASVKENIGMANFDRAYRDDVAPERLARRENDYMLAGKFKMVSKPMLYDDHMAHYVTHYKAIQYDRFKRLPKWITGDYMPGSPFFAKGFLGHLMVHVMLMVREVNLERQQGSTARLQIYGQLDGWTLFAQFFMAGGQLPGDAMPEEMAAAGMDPSMLPPEYQGILPQNTTELPGSVGAPQNFAPSGMPPNPPPPGPGTVLPQVTSIDLARQRRT